ncbi:MULTISPECIES: DNA-processing protein DprA [Paenarthrobacter]|uniref:DNA-processing protein DprA n=1 Tax=Paenarthrobacter ureafaciens TaxID=37931 RepID=A0AAX3ED38_PAEUR|nr:MULTISPECIES: DNA-processing protein DprA [Paenarthrobacter]NKR13862.1 DNA processing protein DprA [Arthrobacter sp. M5]NKR14387.1 DNA processing protein DprA [Arthrobacter sp. M6]OEH62252.1 DNA processing protein DprA [Arthrobacter sp. D4]OEH62823.1 DNA processing protein DprA [Arthrobacter sp. D2]MDO5864973.1 DNA-processing protein DprA [Paenarthrobacter sp. SD-2]
MNGTSKGATELAELTVQEKERIARAALSRLMEPQDIVGLALVRAVGALDALGIATGELSAGASVEREITALLSQDGTTPTWTGMATSQRRWAPRVRDLAPERDLATMRRLGGRLVIPGDELWPGQLADLGLQEPLCLWWRGPERPIPSPRRIIAVVGSRDSTSYGASVAGDFAHGLAQRGYSVVSGGAYGIDAHAHRGALSGGASDMPTIAVMAGGVDRFYPAGNEDLLRTVTHQGALIAEVPPGSAPTRYRFLQRNRLIAALASVTVVVEARWRSGALNTAHHAESIGRIVATVPGSIHSANSAGCHRLLRDGGAVCVTDVGEVAELSGRSGEWMAADKETPAEPQDGLSLEDLILLDALPLRSASSVDKLATVAGLSPDAVRAGLGRLGLLGLASSERGAWKRSGNA